MIQQFDLKKEYAILEDEIQNELKKVFSKTNFIGGENVVSIENNIAKYIGTKYAISCNFFCNSSNAHPKYTGSIQVSPVSLILHAN